MKKHKNTVKTVKGYAIFNAEDEVYMNAYFSACDENEVPYVYNNIKYAQEEIKDHDDVEDYEIHKIKYEI